jgi:hypothetical protein
VNKLVSVSSDLPKIKNRAPRWRKARREVLRTQGITPANRHYIVMVRNQQLPLKFYKFIIEPLGEINGHLFMPARDLPLIFRKAWLLRQVEYRNCEMYLRPLVGQEATNRRNMVQTSPGARRTPCGDRCLIDRASGLWKKLFRNLRALPDALDMVTSNCGLVATGG